MWDWGDGQTTTGWFPQSHTYLSAGKYTIKIVSYDTNGNYRWVGGSVTVSAPQQPVTPSTSASPLILVPHNMVVQATSGLGATVHYSVTALSAGGLLTPVCNPPSDSQFPIGTTTVTCSVTDAAGNSAQKSFTVTVNSASIVIPGWIKNLGSLWCNDQIDDSNFVQGIQWLITNNIMVIPNVQQSSPSGTSQQIPKWVKNDACWWAQGQISDDEFVKGIQWLVSNGIINLGPTTVTQPQEQQQQPQQQQQNTPETFRSCVYSHFSSPYIPASPPSCSDTSDQPEPTVCNGKDIGTVRYDQVKDLC